MYNYQEDEKEVKVSFSIWKKLFSILKLLKKDIIMLVILATILASLDALLNVMNLYAIENFIEARNDSLLPGYIVINVLYAFGFGFIVWLFIRRGSKIEANVNYYIRKEAFANIQRLLFDYFYKTPQGWIMSRMTSDSKLLSNFVLLFGYFVEAVVKFRIMLIIILEKKHLLISNDYHLIILIIHHKGGLWQE